MIWSAYQTRRFSLMWIGCGNCLRLTIRSSVDRAIGTIASTSLRLSLLRSSFLCSSASSIVALSLVGQHLLSHACQKPAVIIELSQRDPHQLMLAFHEVAHADARSLAQ